MKKKILIIDVAKCENCNNCFLACKDEHCGNNWPGYSRPQPLHGHRWMNIHRRERGQFPFVDAAYLPMPCMHCEDPLCMRVSGKGIITKREDGIVLIDPDKAKGRRKMVNACPYSAIWWNAEEEIPQKCTFCAHLLDQGWTKPRCVQACPTGALSFCELEKEELREMINSQKLEVPGKRSRGTFPGVYYRNLYRYEKCFIAGSVAAEKEGIQDCVSGANIILYKDQKKLQEIRSDAFGDFTFDNLSKDSGDYVIEIIHPELGSKKINAHLGSSYAVGNIFMP